jgi:para-nitrobenzyl esterase
MHRRHFLGLGGATLAAASLPAHVARLLAQANAPAAANGPVVEIASGRIRGTLGSGASDGGVRIFKGVPYGASTAGANRFMPPVRPTAWTGVRDAVAYGPRAPQPFRPMIPEIGDALTGSGPMDEDCLRLNVWTPATGAGRRPVMVWFHGGGQRTGSGNSIFYDGAGLARDHDAVVVTVNHRLNAFAHLYLAGVPGTGERFARTSNIGLLDLIAALEWVRDNIGQFGGDPGNVTLFGQSGGGGKTAMLTAMPAASGLFHRAIIMSTLADTAITGLEPERAVQAAELLLMRLGIRAADAARLQQLPVEQLVSALTGGGAAGGGAEAAQPAADLSTRYVPVVDGRTLPRDPFEPGASPLSATIPMMLGSNECEGIPYGNPDAAYWRTEPADAAGLRTQVMQMMRIDAAAADRLITLYRTNRPRDSFGDIAAIMSGDNSALRLSAYEIAEKKVAQGQAPAFMYYFDWRSPVRNGKLRSMHCMELPFVFAHPNLIGFMTGTGPERAELARNMAGAFVAFARAGNPSHPGIPRWDPFTTARRETMVFNTQIRQVNDPYGEERRAMAAIRAGRTA